MGVPRLYKYLSDKNKEAFSKNIRYNIDIIGIDMNAELYPLISKLFINNERKYISLKKEEREKEIVKDMGIFLNLRILNLINEYRPKKIIIAFDGPSPAAKMSQQKSRRLLQENKSFNKFGWTNSNFSPGTEFMEELSIELKKYLSMLYQNKYINEIIYSSHRVPGEGEQKILRYLKKNKDKSNILIIGNDADLAVLFLISKLNVTVLREDKDNKTFVNLKKLKETIKNLFLSSENFAICTYMLGNDFIHPVAGFYDLEKSLDFLSEKIRELNIILGKNDINFINFIQFLTYLVQENSIKYIYSEYDDIKNATKLTQEQYDNVIKMQYSETEKRMSVDDDLVNSDITYRWFLMIKWMFSYYHGNPINNLIQFSYDKHPNLTSLSKFTNFNSLNIVDDYYPTLTPVKTLISVVSYWNMLVSNDIKNYVMTTLPDLYPTTVMIDYSVASEEYLSIVKVPPVPYNRVITLKKLGPLDSFEQEILIDSDFIVERFINLQLLNINFNISSNPITTFTLDDNSMYLASKEFIIMNYNLSNSVSFDQNYSFIPQLKFLFPNIRFSLNPSPNSLSISFNSYPSHKSLKYMIYTKLEQYMPRGYLLLPPTNLYTQSILIHTDNIDLKYQYDIPSLQNYLSFHNYIKGNYYNSCFIYIESLYTSLFFQPSIPQPSIPQSSITQPSIPQSSIPQPSITQPSITQPSIPSQQEIKKRDIEKLKEKLINSLLNEGIKNIKAKNMVNNIMKYYEKNKIEPFSNNKLSNEIIENFEDIGIDINEKIKEIIEN